MEREAGCWGGSSPPRLEIPREVLNIAKKLEDAGYETWCVGGAIRDALLAKPHNDFDLTTAAPPPEVQRLFKRTVPVGIEHGRAIGQWRESYPHPKPPAGKRTWPAGRGATGRAGGRERE